METAQIQAIIDAHRDQPGATLPILHTIQAVVGYVPEPAIEMIAQALNLSRAEVHGVVTFYHHFRTSPAGQHVLEICRAESCQAVGGRGLAAHAKAALGVDWHETTADGSVTLEPVYCLGHCACSPAIRVDEEMHGRVTPESFDALMRDLRSQK